MKTLKLIGSLVTAALVVCLGAAGAYAAEVYSEDPPDRVARISLIRGDVSLQPAGVDEWAPAALNRPLTTDDELWLEDGARAELQVGTVNIHLASGTSFSFTDLSSNVLQMQLTDGALHINVRQLYDGEIIEVDTPHAAVVFTEPGDYRVEVLGVDRTLVKTYSGEAEVIGSGDPVLVGPREQVALGDNGGRVAHQSFTGRDEFDTWAAERNNRALSSTASRHVAPGVIGYEDLDDHGRWANEVDYGYVWYPTHVVAGWAPFRHGHWIWISPWGWTWVDDAPWGFAPSHYGRWANLRGHWAWVPGPRHVRAVYAPALVAWVGGPHTSVSISFGSNVGWFPLGPREVYVPGYHHSRHYLHNVNYTNTVIINNVIINRAYSNRSTHIPYSHRHNRHAVTVTSRDAFVGSRRVDKHIVRARDNDIRDWRTWNAAPAIAPNRTSTLGVLHSAGEGRKTIRTPTSHRSREVVVNRTPPPRRGTFEQERRAIEANASRPVARREIALNPRERVSPRADRPRQETRAQPTQGFQSREQGTARRSEPLRSDSPRSEPLRSGPPRIANTPRERSNDVPRRVQRVEGVQRPNPVTAFRAPGGVAQQTSPPQVREPVVRAAPQPVQSWRATEQRQSQSVAPRQSEAPRQSGPPRRSEAPRPDERLQSEPARQPKRGTLSDNYEEMQEP